MTESQLLNLHVLFNIQNYCCGVNVFTDLDTYWSCKHPLATIFLPSFLITLYQPDIVIFNAEKRDIRLLELICPFNSVEHLQAAREQKPSKLEY